MAQAFEGDRGGRLALDALVACPGCDALYRRVPLADGARARCIRCRSVVETCKHGVVQRLLATVLSLALLLLAAVSFPFLALSKAGIQAHVSVTEAVFSLTREGLWVALVALAFVVGVPLLRALAQIYVLAPIAVGRGPAPHAARIYRHVIALRPWAMAEVFTIGVLVSMVKIGAMADVVIGPAFLALFAIVFLVACESLFTCETTLWKLIDPC